MPITAGGSLAIGLIISLAAFHQPDRVDAVRHILDDWTSRAATREALMDLGGDVVKYIGQVAADPEESHLRRSRAITLLGTLESPSSASALKIVVEDAEPQWRCLAVHALAEMATSDVIPILIGKLEDDAVCMKVTSTDGGTEQDVFVSDEAVRALENVTGFAFEPTPSPREHRDPRPWQKWWRDTHAR